MAISNSLAGNLIDASRLNAIFRCELASFLENLPDYNLSETSAASGDPISWLSVFAPEAINEESKSALQEVIYKLRSRSTYRLVGWFQELPLKIALYGIDRDYAHLGSHIENLSYAESELRWYIMDSLALVAAVFPRGEEVQGKRKWLGVPHARNVPLSASLRQSGRFWGRRENLPEAIADIPVRGLNKL